MHVTVDLEVCGPKRCKLLRDVMVDTGATFTTISEEDADEVGVTITIPKKFITAKAVDTFPVGAALVKLNDREMWNPITISKEGRRAIGTLSLESFRLKVNPVTGELEDAGPLRA